MPRAGDRAREDANIKYEKLMNELEQNPEYRAQLDEKRREKEARNAPLNQAAMQELRGMFAPDRLDADPDLRRKVQKSPELTLIGLDHRVRCHGDGNACHVDCFIVCPRTSPIAMVRMLCCRRY
jgi:hypothetical protein